MKTRNQSSGGCQLLVQETPNPNDQQVSFDFLTKNTPCKAKRTKKMLLSFWFHV